MIKKILKKDVVLTISGILALFSSICLRPSLDELKACVDVRTLVLLFCLMTVTAGLSEAGLFTSLADRLTGSGAPDNMIRNNNEGQLSEGPAKNSLLKSSLILILLCYFVSMLVTNDAALITFVPITILVMNKRCGRGNNKENIQDVNMYKVIVLETIAANLGSMITPFGNPQNLYLYTYYEMQPVEFFIAVIPWGVAGLSAVVGLCVFMVKENQGTQTEFSEELLDENGNAVNNDIENTEDLVRENEDYENEEWYSEKILLSEGKSPISKRSKNAMYIIMFMLSISAVMRVLPYQLAGLLVAAMVLAADRKILLRVDYGLLLTFVFFFVFAGNISGMESVHDFISSQIAGKTVLLSAAASQIISNVPAAIMLSGFTDDGIGLLLGTDIGGLGTPVASMASLISLRFYMKAPVHDGKKYIVLFMLLNLTLLIIMLCAYEYLN